MIYDYIYLNLNLSIHLKNSYFILYVKLIFAFYNVILIDITGKSWAIITQVSGYKLSDKDWINRNFVTEVSKKISFYFHSNFKYLQSFQSLI
jgi:hypothetical protein